MYHLHTPSPLTLGTLAPDLPSGEAFAKILHQAGMKADVHHFTIAPRVIGDKINKDPQVARDLQVAFDAMEDMGYQQIAIACNTLQLWLPKIKTKAKVYSTFDAIKKYFPHGEKFLWLGTTPLVSSMKGEFETLLTKSEFRLQNLVQEIIWRTKAVTGAYYDLSIQLEFADSADVLTKKVNELISGLKTQKVPGIILGCTELPIAFSYASENLGSIQAYDPATYMAKLIAKT